jgi:hypothetical protein
MTWTVGGRCGPLEILCERGRTMLALEYPGGEPLERMIPEEAHEEFL